MTKKHDTKKAPNQEKSIKNTKLQPANYQTTGSILILSISTDLIFHSLQNTKAMMKNPQMHFVQINLIPSIICEL